MDDEDRSLSGSEDEVLGDIPDTLVGGIKVPLDYMLMRRTSQEDFDSADDQKFIKRVQHFDEIDERRSSGGSIPNINLETAGLDDVPESEEVALERIREAQKKPRRAHGSGSRGRNSFRRSSLEDYEQSEDIQYVSKLKRFSSTSPNKFKNKSLSLQPPLSPLAERISREESSAADDQSFIERITRHHSGQGSAPFSSKAIPVAKTIDDSQVFVNKVYEYNSPPSQESMLSNSANGSNFFDKVKKLNLKKKRPSRETSNISGRPKETQTRGGANQTFVEKIKRFNSLTGSLASPPTSKKFSPHLDNVEEVSALPEAPRVKDLEKLTGKKFVERIKRWDSVTGKAVKKPSPHSRAKPMLEPFREGVSVPLDDKEYELESGFVDRIRRFDSVTGQVTENTPRVYTGPSQMAIIEETTPTRKPQVPSLNDDLNYVERIRRFDSSTGHVRDEPRAVSPFAPRVSVVREEPEHQISQSSHIGSSFTDRVTRYDSITQKVRSAPVKQNYAPRLDNVDESITPRPTYSHSHKKSQDAFVSRVKRYNSITGNVSKPKSQSGFVSTLEEVSEVEVPDIPMTRENTDFVKKIKRYDSVSGSIVEQKMSKAMPGMGAIEEVEEATSDQRPKLPSTGLNFVDRIRRYDSVSGKTISRSNTPVKYTPDAGLIQEENSDSITVPSQPGNASGKFVARIRRYDSMTGTVGSPESQPVFQPMEQLDENPEAPIIAAGAFADMKFTDKIKRYDSVTNVLASAPKKSAHAPRAMTPISEALGTPASSSSYSNANSGSFLHNLRSSSSEEKDQVFEDFAEEDEEEEEVEDSKPRKNSALSQPIRNSTLDKWKSKVVSIQKDASELEEEEVTEHAHFRKVKHKSLKYLSTHRSSVKDMFKGLTAILPAAIPENPTKESSSNSSSMTSSQSGLMDPSKSTLLPQSVDLKGISVTKEDLGSKARRAMFKRSPSGNVSFREGSQFSMDSGKTQEATREELKTVFLAIASVYRAGAITRTQKVLLKGLAISNDVRTLEVTREYMDNNDFSRYGINLTSLVDDNGEH